MSSIKAYSSVIVSDLSDMQSQIDTVTETMSSVEQKVDANTKSITDKVWQSDITTSINNYDNTTTKELRDRVTQTETDITGIKSTVSDVKTTLETKADGSTVTKLEETVTQNKQDADGFKQTVSKTYATKDSLNDYLTSEQVRSEIKQTADKIDLLVSSDEESGELSITPDGISAIAKDIQLTGKNITLDGDTTVNGDFVLNNGLIKNSSYEPPTNNSVFSNNGMQIDVEKSTITSKNFSIDKEGNVSIKGNVEADSGKIGDCTIDNGHLKVGSGNLDVGNYMQLTYNLVENENGELVNGDIPMILLGKYPFYLSISSEGLNFYQSESPERIRTNEAYPIAYLANNKLQINQSVVIQQMDVGDQTNGQWSWKTHVVNGKNNLYLKWLG